MRMLLNAEIDAAGAKLNTIEPEVVAARFPTKKSARVFAFRQQVDYVKQRADAPVRATR
jgi:hypothetical protein